jgi:N-acetyl-anhydromuramyl-L-alanine amidase AmpD
MLESIAWLPGEGRKINCPNHNKVVEQRIGVMIHFDDSGTDASALQWFEDARCKVSYNYLVLDDGSYVVVAPEERRAWHAGYCKPSTAQLSYRDANSAFIGIAAATNDRVRATPEQHFTIAWLTREVFKRNGWDLSEGWRITGHENEAVYGPAHPRAGQRGRKIDPTGLKPDDPIVSLARVRSYLRLIK